MTSRTALLVELWPGKPHPFGATWDGEGVNFALFSAHAERVDLCLFDEGGRREIQRIELRNRTHDVWHGYLPQARPGLLYGYRVYGPYQPDRGHRFNPHKLLLDPYARSIVGQLRWSDAHFGYTIGHKREDLSFDKRDSAGGMPKCQVIDSAFSWGEDRRPRIPWNDMVVYELHLAGFTKRHPEVPPQLQGTFAGLGWPAVVDHLRRLGVTTVEILPVHAFVDDRPLVQRGLRNYWGYNSIGYFAPDPRYASGAAVTEFKTMVRILHSAGIEVILDVVYNHTGESNARGPTLSFRGIDNSSYYRLGKDARFYEDFTGCGNTLDLRHPRVLGMVADSLRYWATEMHVDGFRFDLATTLARESPDFDPNGRFFAVLNQDPVLAQRKLIAEPWDLGPHGYRVGGFPRGWSEWNDQYRDTMRAYWRGDGGHIDDFARRLTGSEDLFNGRGPSASINFMTAHDGFTLHDLVSYNQKHNLANGEDNRDGHTHNLSWNYGVEGPADDAAISALREQQKRNLLATLLLSQGVPMLLAGDEMGRTQAGNNNAYCHDNETNWINWHLDPAQERLRAFTQRLIQLRRGHPLFRRPDFFRGIAIAGEGPKDIAWLKPDGLEMTTEEWHKHFARCLGVWLWGEALGETDDRGRAIRDASFLLLFNAHHETIDFQIPAPARGAIWVAEIDTSSETGDPPAGSAQPSAIYPLKGRSLAVLRQVPAGGE